MGHVSFIPVPLKSKSAAIVTIYIIYYLCVWMAVRVFLELDSVFKDATN